MWNSSHFFRLAAGAQLGMLKIIWGNTQYRKTELVKNLTIFFTIFPSFLLVPKQFLRVKFRVTDVLRLNEVEVWKTNKTSLELGLLFNSFVSCLCIRL